MCWTGQGDLELSDLIQGSAESPSVGHMKHGSLIYEVTCIFVCLAGLWNRCKYPEECYNGWWKGGGDTERLFTDQGACDSDR